MPAEWRLRIGLSRARTALPPGTAGLATVVGGPNQLLEWLEEQLGLLRPSEAYTARVTRYADLLERADGESYRDSLDTDRWATASRLLELRDELRMAGWDGGDREDIPPLVRDLAAVEDEGHVPDGVPERLDAVVETIDDGQSLPTHMVVLEDDRDRWSPRWDAVLDELSLQRADQLEPQADAGSALGSFQAAALGQEADLDDLDSSLRWVRAASLHRACQAIASMLSDADAAEGTAIYCPSEQALEVLEDTLSAEGLPVPGVVRGLGAHPVLQVLPLAIELCWDPVDPDVLLDLLALPVGPIHSGAAQRLERALSEDPGLGSEAWQQTLATIEGWDDGEEIAAEVREWVNPARVRVGDPIPADLVEERCRTVARWARGYAEALDPDEDEEGEPDPLAEPLRVAASQASALGDLVEARGGLLRKAQVARMLEDVQEAGSRRVTTPAEAGSVWVVQTLADVPRECRRLVWLGTGLEDVPSTRWTRRQRSQLEEAGIPVDASADRLAAQRTAERRGLARVSDSVLAVELPGDEEHRTHPLWTHCVGLLTEGHDRPDPVRLADVLAGEATLDPWAIDTAERDGISPQPQRPQWTVDPELLSTPDRSSASEMRERLSCPIRWTFKRVADLERSPAARLPEGFRLRGKFAHKVLEKVLNATEGAPDEDEVLDDVGRTFDERVHLDAAPLAHPAMSPERGELRDELQDAVRTLVDVLNRGDYRVVEAEAPIEATLDGRSVGGSIDSVFENEEGEAIVDFKHAGSKYRDSLADGEALQLAVYARARAEQTDADELPPVGYLIIKDAEFHTPEGSPLTGSRGHDVVEDAPAIGEVGDALAEALQGCRPWLEGEEPIPATPLFPEEEWPDGASMAIETKRWKSREELVPCKYCDYDRLCGLGGVD